MEKLALLESVLGQSHPAHASNHSFHCPFCNHPKPKLNVSLDTGAWGCWVCGSEDGSKSKGRSVAVLFSRVNAPKDKIERAKVLWNERRDQSKVNKKNQLTLPDDYQPLWIEDGSFFNTKARNYLINKRKLTKLDLVKYRIGHCLNGRYSNRIIFPSYDTSGQLNFFSGRSYLENPVIKFLIPKEIDKDIITYEDQINWREPVILVESQLDAITIRRNAVPLNGKMVMDRLKQKIIDEQVPKVIMCLDGDANLSLMQQARYFIKNGIPVYKVDLPVDQDPNSIGYDGIWRMIDKAIEIREFDSFSFKIHSLLR